MSLYDYEVSRKIAAADPPFASLVMAALRKADSTNAAIIRHAWPQIAAEAQRRYDAPGGVLPGEVRL